MIHDTETSPVPDYVLTVAPECAFLSHMWRDMVTLKMFYWDGEYRAETERVAPFVGYGKTQKDAVIDALEWLHISIGRAIDALNEQD